MRQPHTAPSCQPDPDDIAFWPDGEWARLDVVWSYGFEWKADDYEIVARASPNSESTSISRDPRPPGRIFRPVGWPRAISR